VAEVAPQGPGSYPLAKRRFAVEPPVGREPYAGQADVRTVGGAPVNGRLYAI